MNKFFSDRKIATSLITVVKTIPFKKFIKNISRAKQMLSTTLHDEENL